MRDIEATRLLHSMLRIDGCAGAEGRAARFLARELTHRGLTAEISSSGSVVATCGSGPRSLALLGWLEAPTHSASVRLDGEHVHGPGAVSGKGPLAAFAAAMTRYLLTHPRGLRVVLIAHESGSEVDLTGLSLGADFAPDYVLAGRANSWNQVSDRIERSPSCEAARGSADSRTGFASAAERLTSALSGAMCAHAEQASQASTPAMPASWLLPRLSESWDCPALFYSAGDPELAGRADECLPIGSFTRSVAVLTDTMRALADGAAGRLPEPRNDSGSHSRSA